MSEARRRGARRDEARHESEVTRSGVKAETTGVNLYLASCIVR